MRVWCGRRQGRAGSFEINCQRFISDVLAEVIERCSPKTGQAEGESEISIMSPDSEINGQRFISDVLAALIERCSPKTGQAEGESEIGIMSPEYRSTEYPPSRIGYVPRFRFPDLHRFNRMSRGFQPARPLEHS